MVDCVYLQTDNIINLELRLILQQQQLLQPLQPLHLEAHQQIPLQEVELVTALVDRTVSMQSSEQRGRSTWELQLIRDFSQLERMLLSSKQTLVK